MPLDLTVHLLRLEYQALEPIAFPAPLPGNILRGALGTLLSPEHFAPQAPTGPSGLRDRPRPYAFRARHLAGQSLPAHSRFAFALHIFETDPAPFRRAFSNLSRLCGAPVELLSHQLETRRLDLTPRADAPRKIEVEFLTPTELKRDFDFAGLLLTIRDRLSNLRAFHGSGPLPIDHLAFAEHARQIQTLATDIHPVIAARRSSRTGQTHPLSGFTGRLSAAGDLREVLPFLDAATLTGVGRQASWGKGEIAWRAID